MSNNQNKGGYFQIATWYADLSIKNITVTIPPRPTFDEYTHYLDFAQGDVVSDDAFVANEHFSISNSALTSAGLHNAIFYFNKKTESFGVLKTEATLKSETKGGWDSSYITLRLPEVPSSIASNKGITFFLKGNEFGLRINRGQSHEASDFVTIFTDYSFDDYRKIYFEDDRENDIISIFVNNDSGEKTLVSTVTLNGANYEIKSAEGTSISTGTITVEGDVASSMSKDGYVQFSTWYNTLSIKDVKIILPSAEPEKFVCENGTIKVNLSGAQYAEKVMIVGLYQNNKIIKMFTRKIVLTDNKFNFETSSFAPGNYTAKLMILKSLRSLSPFEAPIEISF